MCFQLSLLRASKGQLIKLGLSELEQLMSAISEDFTKEKTVSAVFVIGASMHNDG